MGTRASVMLQVFGTAKQAVINKVGASFVSKKNGVSFFFKALFSSKIFRLSATVALSFLFGKNYSIIDYLGLKDSSHDFSANCVISFFFVYI